MLRGARLVADYVLVIDIGELAGAKQYKALNDLMYGFGFTLRGPETLRPVQFSLTSGLPLGRIRQMVGRRINAELQTNVIIDAYEIRQLLEFSVTRLSHSRRFR